ncbi:Cytochrome P450 [Trinorchestia longiramus]|nr:Cytochrome P450 [Trinorchestia longiramus]
MLQARSLSSVLEHEVEARRSVSISVVEVWLTPSNQRSSCWTFFQPPMVRQAFLNKKFHIIDLNIECFDSNNKMWLEIFLLLLLLLVYAVIKDRRPRNYPPGMWEIPFIGNTPMLEAEQVQKLKKYGDIVMHRTGNFRTIYLFDYTVAKQVMGRLEFADRPEMIRAFSIDDLTLGGVLGSNGAYWQHDRRFVLRNLRNLGMGKSYLEEAINIEAKALVEDLKKYNGEAINYPDSFRTVALNIIWQMVASTRYDLRSTKVDTVYEVNKEFHDKLKPYMLLPLFVPWLKILPKPIKNFCFKEYLTDNFLDEMRRVVGEAVDKHLEDYDPDNPRDLIDEYIKGMKENEGNEDSFFRRGADHMHHLSPLALNQIVSDMFSAGSDTVNHMLKWVVFFLARYPDCVTRMQKEIDAVVPRDRMVSLDDKPNLPLVEAFTTEALRESSLVPLSVQRAAHSDTTIEGYFVPKGTMVAVGSYSIHHDPRYWNDPHKFYPERFLDETGTKFTAPKQGFFAFGSGRRQCAGELLARMELFLFTAAIVQNFDVMAEEGIDLSKAEILTLGAFRVPSNTPFMYRPRI